MVFISLERRETFRDAVFLWITPFFAALSIIDFAISSLVSAASFDCSLTASRTSLTMFFILVFEDLLRRRLFSFWRARFIAELQLANFISSFQSDIINKNKPSTELLKICQALFSVTCRIPETSN